MDGVASRSPVLVFFAAVANLYLLTFAADAFVSVADEFWAMAAGSSPLTGVRNQLAWLTLWATLGMLGVIAIVPHLPKSVFFPLIGAFVWLAFGGPPFGSLAQSGDSAGLFLALCQATLAMAAFFITHVRTGSPFLSADALPHLQHVFLRIAFAACVTLIVGVLGLFALGIATAVSYAEQETKGYLQFTWSDIRARTAILRRDNKTVHLLATAHVAERSFYEQAYASIPPSAVVLAEGITDKKGVLAAVPANADDAAKALGLDSQDVFEDLLGGGVVLPVPSTPVAAERTRPGPVPEPIAAPAPGKPIVVRADVDVSDLSPATLRCLRADLAAKMERGGTLDKDGGAPACSEKDLEVFWDEILVKRNAVVVAAFDKLADKYDTFVLPWGAMHMPGLEKAFLERGFKVERARMLTLARYDTVAGHVLGGLAAFRLLGPGNRPYTMHTVRPAARD